MRIEELAEAIQNPRPWLARFRKREYPEAFRDYRELYGPLFDRAAREAEDVTVLAEELAAAWERGWRRHGFFSRSTVQAEEKQVLTVYLSPMLLEREEPAARTLCRCLREVWAGRRPRDAYQLASFETLQAGFQDSILGIPLKDRQGKSER